MTWLKVMRARWRGLFARPDNERRFDDEVCFHLDMQAEDNRKAGMSPDAARKDALRRFGGVQPIKEVYREAGSFAAIENAGRDLRYAVRTLRRSPAFAITSVAVLGLAMGACTAMF